MRLFLSISQGYLLLFQRLTRLAIMPGCITLQALCRSPAYLVLTLENGDFEYGFTYRTHSGKIELLSCIEAGVRIILSFGGRRRFLRGQDIHLCEPGSHFNRTRSSKSRTTTPGAYLNHKCPM